MSCCSRGSDQPESQCHTTSQGFRCPLRVLHYVFADLFFQSKFQIQARPVGGHEISQDRAVSPPVILANVCMYVCMYVCTFAVESLCGPRFGFFESISGPSFALLIFAQFYSFLVQE